MSSPAPRPPTFGVPAAGVVSVPRQAAYVVIRDGAGAVAAVRGLDGYWLPGGGRLPGETADATAQREAREELGRGVRLVGRIGFALQYFFAARERTHYKMTVEFFRAEFTDGEAVRGEFELYWLDVSRPGRLFYHECHDWAARQA